MSSSGEKLDYPGFIEFLSKDGFSGKLSCDIKVSYQIKDDDKKLNLKFLKNCKYRLQGFDLLYFVPTKGVTILVGRDYSPTFQIDE